MATVYTLGNLVPEVIAGVENRTTAGARALIWLQKALLEITADPQLRNEFDELEVIGPVFNLTGGRSINAGAVQQYPFSNFIPAGDYNVSTLDIVLWTDYPNNTTQIRLDTTSYQDADAITRFVGQPVKWYRFGDLCGFVPVPDKNYQTQARIYRMHPFSVPLENTPILIGNNWNEVLTLAATEKGFIELLQFEKARSIHGILHGDPKKPELLGMIEGRKKRREKENWRKQVPLRPVYRGYGRRY